MEYQYQAEPPGPLKGEFLKVRKKKRHYKARSNNAVEKTALRTNFHSTPLMFVEDQINLFKNVVKREAKKQDSDTGINNFIA